VERSVRGVLGRRVTMFARLLLLARHVYARYGTSWLEMVADLSDVRGDATEGMRGGVGGSRARKRLCRFEGRMKAMGSPWRLRVRNTRTWMFLRLLPVGPVAVLGCLSGAQLFEG
jgi:hypothetical protein